MSDLEAIDPELDNLMSQLEEYALDLDDIFIWEFLISVDNEFPSLNMVILSMPTGKTSHFNFYF